MNQELIIELAKEARIHRDDSWRFEMLSERNALEAFAALVAAAEREACAELCEVIIEKNTWWDINEIEAAEECAAKIRARGETK